jgi:hypothetical protein
MFIDVTTNNDVITVTVISAAVAVVAIVIFSI